MKQYHNYFKIFLKCNVMTYILNSKHSYVLKIETYYNRLQYIEVDDQILNQHNYIVKQRSTIMNSNKDYTNTL